MHQNIGLEPLSHPWMQVALINKTPVSRVRFIGGFHRHDMVIQSAIISFDLISNINRSSQLGHRRRSIGSCWRYLVSNVCPRQSIGRRQIRSNTYELPWCALQHFFSSWLIKQLDLFSSASHLYSWFTYSTTWLLQLDGDLISAVLLKPGMNRNANSSGNS